MISNIVVAGINRVFSRQVSEILAEQLGMHFLDTIELFEFDHIPRNLAMVLDELGEGYFRKKEKSLSGYVGEFENSVLHVESGCVLESGNIDALKQNAIVIYLHMAPTKIKKELSSAKYKTENLRKFFNISLVKIKNRDMLWMAGANITIDVKASSPLKCAADTIRAIEKYYLK